MEKRETSGVTAGKAKSGPGQSSGEICSLYCGLARYKMKQMKKPALRYVLRRKRRVLVER